MKRVAITTPAPMIVETVLDKWEENAPFRLAGAALAGFLGGWVMFVIFMMVP